jgi:hypothetical protein
MPGTTGFRLDEEQRAQIRDCLDKADLRLSRVEFEQFTSDIEDSISRFLLVEPSGGLRKAHDALRAIWSLARADDPQVAVLRERVRGLRGVALEYIGRRAARLIRRLFPNDLFEEISFSEGGGFVAWADTASGDKLARALRILTANGAQIVLGRSRGRGQRSSSRMEPVILGEARGTGSSRRKGGRAIEYARLELVIALGLDWLRATGKGPKHGRSGETAFGDLVHGIFLWLEISRDPYEAATYTLRRYSTLRNRRSSV